MGKETTQYVIEIGSTRFLMFTVGAPNERPLAVARGTIHRRSSQLHSPQNQPSPQSLRRLEHEYSLAGRARSRVGGQASSAHSSRRANNPFTE